MCVCPEGEHGIESREPWTRAEAGKSGRVEGVAGDTGTQLRGKRSVCYTREALGHKNSVALSLARSTGVCRRSVAGDQKERESEGVHASPFSLSLSFELTSRTLLRIETQQWTRTSETVKTERMQEYAQERESADIRLVCLRLCASPTVRPSAAGIERTCCCCRHALTFVA